MARTSLGRMLAATFTPATVNPDTRRNGNAMTKARRLAERHGITLEREGRGAYWVTCEGLTDTDADPLAGGHFCTGGDEVLAAVEVYVKHKEGKPAAC